MARAMWTGALSFGLVSIPISLYSATQEHEVRFHQFEQGTTSRIRYKRVNQDTGEEVDYSDIAKGTELPSGEYVVLSDKELEEVSPQQTKAIEISDFVELESIDPVYYQKSYFMGPRDDSAGKPYALLAAAIAESGRAAVASFVLRNKEHLAVIRPYDGVLILETMYFADEVKQVDKVLDNRPDRRSLRKQDLDMAMNLIESMSTDWDPKRYHDSYTERVNELVEAKSRDEKFEAPEEEPSAEVIDLTAALQASIDRVRGGGSNKKGANKKDPTKRGSGGTKQGSAKDDRQDVSALSKAELYELAQQLKISGRSSMSRKQLEKAVVEAGAQRAS
ncbi:Ku protein [Microlunatus sp. Gsoil 973]|uniref:non-homologous end joining protein Ku n=1 Tax=Microlunatus sp. Gsoil 973 TaxID=2672569 RepID=UPI0012B496C9|nr:Ku protein [Microlunatus sp. Gsoil 973]QGN32475.1 Ku protein [Microlunatus sp. Gsoil 973]